jgi:hypothetical protein
VGDYLRQAGMTRRKWKAITIDYTALQSYDNTLQIGVCLTQRQIAILKALLIPAYWPTRWTNLIISDDELNEQIAEIDYLLDLGDCVVFDCDAVIACLDDAPQTEINNTLFAALFLSVNATVIVERNADYDGTPGSINPDAPTTTWDSDADRDLALCMAAYNYVTSFAAVKKAEIEKANLLVITSIIAISAASGGLLMGIAAIGGGLLIYTLNQAFNALADDSALVLVACCMYEGLQGKAVNPAAFATALDACGFAPGSNEAIVRDFVADTIGDLTNYLAMLESTGASYGLVQLGIGDCLCTGTFTHTFDFVVSDGAWEIRAEDNRPYGSWVAAQGWTSVFAGSGQGLPNDERLYVQRKGWVNRTITDIEIFYETTGIQGGGNRNSSLSLKLNGGVVASQVFGTFPVPGVFSVVWSGSVLANEIEQSIAGDAAGDNSQFVITSIVVSGIGTDPF